MMTYSRLGFAAGKKTLLVRLSATAEIFSRTRRRRFFCGVAGTVLALCTVQAAPLNDDFANRAVLAGSMVNAGPVAIAGATRQAGEPLHPGATTGVETVWWEWTAPGSGLAVVSTTGSTATGGGALDTVVAVYSGAAVGQLDRVGANDNNGGAPTSSVSFATTGGQTYQIVVAGRTTADTGDVHLAVTHMPVKQPSAIVGTDDFDRRASLWGNHALGVAENSTASVQAGEPPHPGVTNGTHTVWWQWTAPSATTVALKTAGSTTSNGGALDTILAVYSGTTLASLSLVASNDNGSGNGTVTSEVSFTSVSGRVYQIVVAGRSSADDGAIALELTAGGNGGYIPEIVVPPLLPAGAVEINVRALAEQQAGPGSGGVIVGVSGLYPAAAPASGGGNASAQIYDNPQAYNLGRVLRLLSNGQPDAAFTTGEVNGTLNTIVPGHDGRLLVGGKFTTFGGLPAGGLVRLTANGTRDSTFQIGAGATGSVHALAVGPYGIVVGGSFTAFGGQPKSFLVRLKQNGLIDPSFSPLLNGAVNVIKIDNEDRILIGGNFTTVDGVTRARIARLMPWGELDASFDPGAGANDEVVALYIQRNDRRIVAGGAFTSFGGQSRMRLARLETDGALDASFTANANGTVHALVGDLADRLWIGGAFTSINGAAHGHIASLNESGVPYASTGTGANDHVGALLPRADRSILVGGLFDQFLGAPANRMVAFQGSQFSGSVRIVHQPTSRIVDVGQSTWFSATGAETLLLKYGWRFNGVELPGTENPFLSLSSAQPAGVGVYSVYVSAIPGGSWSDTAILGLSTTAKLVGQGTEFPDIVHGNGNVYDQILLQSAAATVTADPGQIVRTSFLDLNDDIVQVEFSGAGNLTLALDAVSGPALPVKYNQAVLYMKGRAKITVVGANETTHLSVFTVGKATAVNQALFQDGTFYDGVADIGHVVISSANGRFGGLRLGNAGFIGTSGMIGLYAPNVRFTGPVFIHDVNGSASAVAYLVTGTIDGGGEIGITGGNLDQFNGQPLMIEKVARIRMRAGSTSRTSVPDLPAQTNGAVILRGGQNVTELVIINP